MAISDDLADRITLHAISLARLESGVRKKVLRHFKQLERELLAVLEKIDPGAPQAQTFRIQRVQKMLDQVQSIIRTSYKEYGAALKGDLRGLSRLEVSAARDELNGVLRAEVASVALPASAINAIVNTSLIRGAVLSDWLSDQSTAFVRRLSSEMHIGALAGEGVPDLTRRIRGTQVPGAPRGTYIGGIMQTTTRDATAIARTSIQTIANNVRIEAYKQNGDIVKGVQALVTLDTRTSEICMGRSGGAWNLKTGNALPQSTVTFSFPGPPPWHWNCRTTLIPITVSWEELGARKQKQIPESTQASMDGQVAEDLTYEQWLKKQTKARRVEALGVTKEKLWREGKVKSLRELVDQTGRPLTVRELEGKRKAV